jgi:hypothetical protein
VPLARDGDRADVLERAVLAIEGSGAADEQRAVLLTSSWVFAGMAARIS